MAYHVVSVNGDDVLKIGLLFFVVGAMLGALHKVCYVQLRKSNTMHASERITEHDVRCTSLAMIC